MIETYMSYRSEKVVVLYSGRWYVNHMSQWIQNHMDCSIKPLRADVAVAFRSDARRMFGAQLKRTDVIVHDDAFPFNNPDQKHLTPF